MTQSDAPLSSPSNLQSSGLSLADAEDDIPIAQTSRTAKSSRSASSAARHHRTPSRSADLALDPDRSTPSAMDRQSSSSFGPKSPSPLTPPKTRTGSTTADEHAFICEYAVCPFGFASQVALVQHKHDVHPPVVSIRTVLGSEWPVVSSDPPFEPVLTDLTPQWAMHQWQRPRSCAAVCTRALSLRAGWRCGSTRTSTATSRAAPPRL